MIKVSDYVVKKLEELNTKYIFILPGGGAMHLNDSIGKSKKIKYVPCLHEQVCSIAGEAYARVSNTLGLVMVTTGPGGTNAITGVAGAYIESTPVMYISGQVKRKDMVNNQKIRQQGMQEVDIVSIVKPITKYAVCIKNEKDIRYEIEKAIYFSMNGRKGPVWIDIPLDIQAMVIDEKKLRPYIPTESDKKLNGYKTKKEIKKYEDKILKLIDDINSKKRPCILIGNGIRLGDCIKEFDKLKKILNIPILTSWNGIDLIEEDDELYFGRPGGLGHRYANFIQQNSDLFISIGCRLNLLQTGFDYKNFAKYAKKVVVDIDKNEINKINVKSDMSFDIDAKIFINLLIKHKNKIKKVDRSEWFSYCNKLKSKYKIIEDSDKIGNAKVNPYNLIDKISDNMKNGDIYVSGSSGSCIDISMQALKIKRGVRAFATKGLASMGYGLPSTIGAAFASGKKKNIWSVQGDGGFVMNIQDLATIKRENLPIKIFVLNNNGYGAIYATQKNVFNKHFVSCDKKTGVELPDFVKVVEAFNIKAIHLKNNCDVETIVKKVKNMREPVVVVCDTDINLTAKIKQINIKNKNGQMESLPLEYMRPMISEEEFKENMLVPYKLYDVFK